MLYIVPAAGKGQRFIDAGFAEPKPFIPITDKMCMADVVLRRPQGVSPMERLLILNQEDAGSYPEQFLNTQCKIVPIKASKGTSETIANAFLMENHSWTDLHRLMDEEVLVSNCDNYVDYDYDLFAAQCRASGKSCGVFVFEANYYDEDKYSFVDAMPSFNKVGEKRDPGHQRFAIAGVYWFRTLRELLLAIDAQQLLIEEQLVTGSEEDSVYIEGEFKQIRHNNEPYLSLAMNMFKSGGHAVLVREADVKVFGTPEQLESFKTSLPF